MISPIPDIAFTITIGSMHLSRLENGMLWLSNSEGEGMQVDEADLEEVLRELFKKEF